MKGAAQMVSDVGTCAGNVNADAGSPADSAPQRESCSSSLGRGRLAAGMVALFSLIFACALAVPSQALASTWPLSASALSYTCGFHESYSAGGGSYVHSGMDVAGKAGGTVRSPLSGTVTFTGTVPSGDSRVGSSGSSQTMRAVSVKIADGRTMTFMPMASVSVKRGQTLAEGEALGTLAASGDVSTSGTHLHMGLKEDGVYYDPMTLFGASSAAEGASASAERAGDEAESEAAAQAEAATEAAAQAEPASEAEAEASGQTEGSTAEEGAFEDAVVEGQAQEELELGTISSGAADYTPQAQQEPSLSQCLVDLFAPLAAACLSQLQGLWAAIQAFCEATGAPVVAVCAALAAGAIAVLACLVAFVVRRLVPFLVSLFKSRIAPLLGSEGGC